jgi:transglutaminase-like putative cysteine protease
VLTGGAFAAVIALAFGALVGPRLPDAEGAALLNWKHTLGHGGQDTEIVDISPLVGIGDKLRQPKPTKLFDVQATHEARWRLMALDNFDGSYWGLQPVKAESTLSPISGPQLPNVTHEQVTQTYAIGPMSGKFLPAAYQAVGKPQIPNLHVLRASATLIVANENHEGLTYSVTSELVGATPATLEAAPKVDPNDPVIAHNLELPSNLDKRVTDLAKRVAGNGSEYDRARRLQDFFRDPKYFKYDPNVQLSESSNAIYDFLFTVRRGFCEQFAGTYAAMARAVGLPTRVAVGFQRGSVISQADNVNGPAVTTYQVTTKDAHAWPEVYFPKVGWIAFEPTPGHYDYASPDDPNGTHAEAPPQSDGPQPPGVSTTTSPTTTVPDNSGTPKSSKLPDIELNPPKNGGAGTGHSSSGRGGLWWLIPALFAFALAAVVISVAALQRVRRWRREHAATTRARVDGAWTQATEDLARRDIRRRPAATLVEFALREAPAAGAGAAGPPLLELAQLQTQAMYAVAEPSAEDADRAWECADRVSAAVRAETPPRERFRQRFGLSPRRGGRKRRFRFT